jgi:hypothetical protein
MWRDFACWQALAAAAAKELNRMDALRKPPQ